MWSRYLGLQRAYPMSTSALTGMGVLALGDSAVQLTVDGKVDPARNAIASLYNAVAAPVLYLWWQYLDRRWPGTVLKAVATKVAVNQVVVTPINSATFIYWCKHAEALAQQHDKTDGEVTDWTAVRLDAFNHLQREIGGLLVSSCAFWPGVNAVNFAYVPVHSRIVFMSSAAVCWGAWLSHVSHR
mmetsp:Transcript_21715/g.64030  ORF Transcript_21715/g.64030 Transcript_21715/m.64030 type:complete len:185 (-) Transcript_21715:320-874(-)